MCKVECSVVSLVWLGVRLVSVVVEGVGLYLGLIVCKSVMFVVIELMIDLVVGMVNLGLVLIGMVILVVVLIVLWGWLVMVIICVLLCVVLCVEWIRLLFVFDWLIISVVVLVIMMFLFSENIDGGKDVMGMFSLCMNL